MWLKAILTTLALVSFVISTKPADALDPPITTPINRPYQEVYRSVREYVKRCMQTGLITAEIKVDAELFTDLKQAEIDIYMQGMLGRIDYFKIQITSTSTKFTSLAVQKGTGSATSFASIHEAAQGNSPSC